MALLQFNNAPYFDDFSASKGYMKVLFKAGVPVQGRELNQIQSIFQDQITQFANNIFKNGSVVSGARNSIQAQAYVRLNNFVTNSTTQAVDVSQFTEGFSLAGVASGVTALYITGFDTDSAGDPPTIYVIYTGTGNDGVQATFIPGEDLNWIDSNGLVVYQTTVRCPGCTGSTQTDTIPPTGMGQIYTVDDGTFYYEGMFLSVSRQMKVVTPYLVKKKNPDGTIVIDSTTLSDGTIPPAPMKIGLDMVQSIVTFQDDSSLLDPALGYPNSTAPGADRYQVQLILNQRGYTDADGDAFIPLCLIGDQMSITYQAMQSEYNSIQDNIAQQFYETDGNYSLAPFKLSFFESLKGTSTDSQGWSTAGSDADLVCLVQPSTAYVKGYRCNVQAPTPIQFPKARDTNSVNGYINQFPERTYLVAQPINGKIWPNDDLDVSMMGTRLISLKNASGSPIGTAYVNDIKLHKVVTTAGQFNQYRYYVYDMQMNAGASIAAVTTMTTDSGFSAALVPDPTSALVTVYNPNTSALIYALQKPNVKTLRDSENNQNGSLQVVLRQKLSGVLNGSGQITFSAATNQAFLLNDAFTTIYVDNAGTYEVVDPTIAGVYNSSGTSLVINTAPAGGGTAWASLPIIVLASVLYTSQKEEQKVLTAGTLTTSVQPNFAVGSVVNLPVSDVQNFTVLWKEYNGTNTDITSEYTLVSGLTDYSYTNSSIVRNTGPTPSETNVNPGDTLQITYNYYNWNGSQGFFTVDSYPVDPNINPSAASNPVDYTDLPTYVLSTKQAIPANQALDFRPQLPSPEVEGYTAITSLLPAQGSTAVFDITYYLARTDLLQISKDNVLYIKPGVSSETPVPPAADANSLALWNISLKAYTYSLSDITTTALASKVYKMSDIANLEGRISNLEYYTALNLLEQTAATMNVTDQDGLNRFKNGFITDNFSDFQAADLTNVEFRAAADTENQQLRPQFKTRNKKLVVDIANSLGFTFIGNTAIGNYTETNIGGNAYATQSISINPFLLYDMSGTMQLSPNNDTWSDDTALPAITVTDDAGMDAFTALATADGVLGTKWSTWPQQNTTILGSTTSTTTSPFTAVVSGGRSAATAQGTITSSTTTNKSATTTTNTGVATTVGSTTQSYSTNAVESVSIIPYCRSIPIQVYAQKMRANTKVYAFFDGVAVSQYCTPLRPQWTSASYQAQGVQLVTDSNGEIMCSFLIPANTFFTGTRVFKFSDDPSGASNPDVETTSAVCSFFSGGLDLTTQASTLNIVSPTLSQEQVTSKSTVINTTSSSTSTIQVNSIASNHATQANPSNVNCTNVGTGTIDVTCLCANKQSGTVCGDPVAQAFQPVQDMFLTATGMYFEQVDPAAPDLYVEIRDTVNGYPGPTVLARKDFNLVDLTAWAVASRGPGALAYSADSMTSVRVPFDIPVFLSGGTLYALVVGGVSPNTRVWEAYLGQTVVNNPGQVVQLPPTGQPSFRSLNGTTWTAQQYETLKYDLYQANFTIGTMTLAMKQAAQDDEQNSFGEYPLGNNPLQVQTGSNQIRVFAKDHGFTEGDTVTLSMFEQVPLIYTATTSNPPQATQLLVAGDSSATIYSTQPTAVANQYSVVISKVHGDFGMGGTTNPVLNCLSPALLGVFPRDKVASKINGSVSVPTQGWTVNAAAGSIARGGTTTVTGGVGSIFPTDNFAGIPLAQLTAQHSIITVDSMDSFIIQSTTPSNFTGDVGGNQAQALSFNEKYDIFNVSGSYLAYNASETWALTGLGYGRVGSPFRAQDNETLSPIGFVPGTDTYLTQPQKYVSNNQNSMLVSCTFANQATNTSPIINLDTFSVTTVSNRVEVINQANMSLAPVNASEPYFVSETDATLPLGGSEQFKYVTQNVVLANPANDLVIYFDLYRDINADFDVYVKALSVNDSRTIDQIPWARADLIDKTSFSTDLTDRIEYQVTCSEQISTWSSSQFTALKVKLVGRTTNSCLCPLFRSLRAIAVT
jgi:hypothetical protein